MANVFDYLKWRDDLKLIKLNEIDVLIFNKLSYFPLENITLCFTFWGLCDIIYMSRMNLEGNIFDWLVSLNSFSTNEMWLANQRYFFGFR